MRSAIAYTLVIVGALLMFAGFLAVLAAAYFLVGAGAALAALLGLVGVGAAGLLVAGDPAEVLEEAEEVSLYAAPEGGNVTHLREGARADG